VKITGIDAIPFAIPYRKPLRFASGEVHTADHVLVRVHTDEGIVGTAEAPPRPYTYGETQRSIIAVIHDLFAPQIAGMSPLEREGIHAKLNRTVGNPTAKAAIDMALWDVVGQALGVSVSDLLGGFTDRMATSHMVGFSSPAAMVAEAEEFRDRYGISTFKVKVGRRPIDEDVAACRALRQHLGDDVVLYVDGNRGWSPAESARALRQMDDLDLAFAEELCPADDVVGRRWLVTQSHIPIFADESVPGPAEVTREVLAGAATGVSIKTARTGFTRSHRILGLAEGLGVDVVLGNQVDGQIGSLCAVTFGAAFERTAERPGELCNFLLMMDDLLTEPLEITDGSLGVREGPGIGVVIDDEKLTRYRTDT
jgi:L-alanine-DL-glutamate epimerase-like enolase superfamily enzyme